MYLLYVKEFLSLANIILPRTGRNKFASENIINEGECLTFISKYFCLNKTRHSPPFPLPRAGVSKNALLFFFFFFSHGIHRVSRFQK
jgi:hypothetical protein